MAAEVSGIKEFSSDSSYNMTLESLFPDSFDEVCCTTNLDSFLNLYSNFAPLWSVNKLPHYVCGVRSQFNLYGWRHMLQGGHDHVFGEGQWDPDAHFLLDGVSHGFKLVNPKAVISSYCNKNYESATISARKEIETIMSKELNSGKLSKVDFQPHCIHSLGAVQNRQVVSDQLQMRVNPTRIPLTIIWNKRSPRLVISR